MNTPLLTVCMGAPGSGKSTWAAGRENVITSDGLRGGAYDRKRTRAIFTDIWRRVDALLAAGENVTLDSTAAHPSIREQALRIARTHKSRTLLVVFDLHLTTCIDRQAGRAAPVAASDVAAMHRVIRTQIPGLQFEGWDDIEIRTTRPVGHPPVRQCVVARCPNYADADGYCGEHRTCIADRTRAAAAPGVTNTNSRFRWMRTAFLMRHPMCASCHSEVATDLDHIERHHGNPRLFWDQANWQGLCAKCHGRKTARETGWRQPRPSATQYRAPVKETRGTA